MTRAMSIISRKMAPAKITRTCPRDRCRLSFFVVIRCGRLSHCGVGFRAMTVRSVICSVPPPPSFISEASGVMNW